MPKQVMAAQGLERRLVEGGGELIFQFLEADARDEMYGHHRRGALPR